MTEQGLFCADVPNDRRYSVLRSDPARQPTRDYLNHIWRCCEARKLLDADFRAKFPVELCQRWWELQVAWFLVLSGVEVSHAAEGPDYRCTKDGCVFYVEAVACKLGDQTNAHSVKPMQFGCFPIDLESEETGELLRFTSVIRDKTKKYWHYRTKHLIHADMPYIIAVSPIEIDCARILISGHDGQDIPAVGKALYGIGLTRLSLDTTTGKVTSVTRDDRSAMDKGGSQVRFDRFRPSNRKCDPYRGVAGVLSSEISLWAHAYPPPEAVLPSQFSFMHNMNGAKSMPLGLLAEGGEYVCESGTNGDWLIRNTRHKGDMPVPEPQLRCGNEHPEGATDETR